LIRCAYPRASPHQVHISAESSQKKAAGASRGVQYGIAASENDRSGTPRALQDAILGLFLVFLRLILPTGGLRADSIGKQSAENGLFRHGLLRGLEEFSYVTYVNSTFGCL